MIDDDMARIEAALAAQEALDSEAELLLLLSQKWNEENSDD